MLTFWATLGLGFFCLWLPASSVHAQLEVPPPSDLPVAILPKAPEDLKKPKVANPTAPAVQGPQRSAWQDPQTAAKPRKTKPALAQEKRKPKSSRPLTLVKADQASRGKLGSRPKELKRATTMTKKAARTTRP